jgi:hypothetical protein
MRRIVQLMATKSSNVDERDMSDRIPSLGVGCQPQYLRRVPAGLLLSVLVGCSAQPPVVAEPPEDMSRAPLEDPWFMDERAMMRNPTVRVTSDSHDGEGFQGPLEGAPSRSFADDFVDVIAFPFRGIGWLLRALF